MPPHRDRNDVVAPLPDEPPQTGGLHAEDSAVGSV